MSSAQKPIDLEGYSIGRSNIDTAITLIDYFQNGSEKFDPEELRAKLTGTIVEFCRSNAVIQHTLGISNQQLEAIGQGDEIPKSVVEKFDMLLRSVRDKVASHL